jgi:hypothetical protein
LPHVERILLKDSTCTRPSVTQSTAQYTAKKIIIFIHVVTGGRSVGIVRLRTEATEFFSFNDVEYGAHYNRPNPLV